jgi:hypothetical protein
MSLGREDPNRLDASGLFVVSNAVVEVASSSGTRRRGTWSVFSLPAVAFIDFDVLGGVWASA